MLKSVNLLYVSDEKAGHRSQALGLYQAYQRLHSTQAITLQEVNIQDLPYTQLLRAMLSHKLDIIQNIPHYIVAVGSHTHLKAWLLSKIYPSAKSIILMKTSFPLQCFDYHVIPQHDGQFTQSNVISTQGVLNPIVNQQRHQKNRILVALGGSSKRHEWQDDVVFNYITDIIENNLQHDVIITTSRRTPSHFLAQVQATFPTESYPNVAYFPVEQTPQGWIFEQMQLAETIWVTADSVSMIFEALTSGAKVGILKLNCVKNDRVSHMIDELLKQPQPLQMTLNEADRVAQLIFKD